MSDQLPEYVIYSILFLAGGAAGLINTLAGSGTIFTLSVLLFIGVPDIVADATNRLGVLVQNVVSLYIFNKKKQRVDLRKHKVPLLGIISGAFLGVYFAVDVTEKTMSNIIVGVMFLLLILMLTSFKPKAKEEGIDEDKDENKTVLGYLFQFTLLFVTGIYGGFIQVGAGIFMLISLSLTTSLSLIKSIVLKQWMAFLFSFPVFLIFVWKGFVRWDYALIISCGQAIGGYIASIFGSNHPNATIWIKRIVITMIVVTIVKTLFF